MLSLGTKRSCISRLVASSMKTSSVQRFTAVLEPAVLAAVDLDQLAIRLTPKPRLMEAPALLARKPHPSLDHPGPQRLATNLDAVLARAASRSPASGRSRRYLVRTSSNAYSRTPALSLMVRRLAPTLVDQASATVLPKPDQQPADLPRA